MKSELKDGISCSFAMITSQSHKMSTSFLGFGHQSPQAKKRTEQRGRKSESDVNGPYLDP